MKQEYTMKLDLEDFKNTVYHMVKDFYGIKKCQYTARKIFINITLNLF